MECAFWGDPVQNPKPLFALQPGHRTRHRTATADLALPQNNFNMAAVARTSAKLSSAAVARPGARAVAVARPAFTPALPSLR
jgi:hypothetical protein